MDEIETKLMRARVRFLRPDRSPFFARLLLGHKWKRGGVNTMATDSKTLFWNPDYVAKLSPDQLDGLLAHEMLHVARGHHLRKGDRDHERWNIACDAAIDWDLKDAGFDVPDSFTKSPQWDWARGLSAEVIYARLPTQQQQPSPGSEGEGDGEGEGEGEGESQGPGTPRAGEVLPAPGNLAQAEMEHQITVRQAILAQQAWEARGRGTTPAWLKAMMDDLTKPRVDWRQVLRQFLAACTPHDRSYARPNRRYRSLGMIMPGDVRDGLPTGVVLLDTSGSMGGWLKQLLTETAVIINDVPRDDVHVMQCDAAVADITTYAPGDQLVLKVAGGGGSDFRPAFAMVEEMGIDPQWMVVISDMMIDWPEDAPPYPVLAFSTTPSLSAPEWAATIHVQEGD